MRLIQILLLIILCSSCGEYRYFSRAPNSKTIKFDNEKDRKNFLQYEKKLNKEFKTIGKRSNKIFDSIDGFGDYDASIIKDSYKELLAVILIENLPDNIDYKNLDSNQGLAIYLYFDTKNFTPEEVYFGTYIMDLFSIFPKKNIENIQNEIKFKIRGEKNIEDFGQEEVERRLNSLKYVRHLIWFNVRELFLVKDGKMPFNKMEY